jgi:anti-anti-sigma factor
MFDLRDASDILTSAPRDSGAFENALPLILDSRHCGNVCVIQCKGRIALGDETKALDIALNHATRESTRLVLNIAEVERLDSTGIGLLVRHAARMHKCGGDLRLAAPPPFVVTLLDLAHLSSFLRVSATEEDAILSYVKYSPAPKAPEKHGPRVLLFDPSEDLCAFVRTVLTQHGFDVKSTGNFGDAKILLRMEDVDYILVGPGTPQLSPETALRGLRAIASKAVTLHLAPDFNCRDAHEATETLLQMFGATSASSPKQN